MKKLHSKVAYFSLIKEIFPHPPDCPNGPKSQIAAVLNCGL